MDNCPPTKRIREMQPRSLHLSSKPRGNVIFKKSIVELGFHPSLLPPYKTTKISIHMHILI
jgi:hypothetical protein